MKVLFTGASGFIGSFTLDHLQASGYTIHAVSRRTQPSQDGMYWYNVDLFDSKRVVELIETVQPTHLLHMAWNVEHGKYWTTLDNFHWVQASLNLIHTFYQHGGQRAVIAGTCAEYDWRYGFCVEQLTPLTLQTPYSACRTSLYQMSMSFAAQSQLSLAWGRIFFPFGPRENPNRLVPYVIRSLLRGEMAETSHGEQFRDFLYVDDLAAAFVALLNSNVQGAVNLASGIPVRLKDIIIALATAIDRPHLVKLGVRPAGDEPPLVVADVTRLHNEVGWSSQTPLVEGLTKTIEWWQKQEGNDEKP